MKTAFIYNFLKFIDFPAGDDIDTLTICIVKPNPFGGTIKILENKKLKNWSLKVKEVEAQGNFDTCQVLFIPADQKEHLEKIFAQIKNKPILTIGETSGFIDKGGIINFIIINNKIRFEINDSVAKSVGIKISSKLLRLARRVK